MNNKYLYAEETLESRQEDRIKWWEVQAERERQKFIKKLYGLKALKGESMCSWFKTKRNKIEGILNGRLSREVSEEEIFAYWDVSAEKAYGAREVSGLHPFETRPECLPFGVILALTKYLSAEELRALRCVNCAWKVTLDLAKATFINCCRSEKRYLSALLNFPESRKRAREFEPFVANKIRRLEPVDAYELLPAEIWGLIFALRGEIMARQTLLPVKVLVLEMKEDIQSFLSKGMPSYTLGGPEEIRARRIDIMEPGPELWMNQANDGPVLQEIRKDDKSMYSLHSLANVFRCHIPDHVECNLVKTDKESEEEMASFLDPECFLAAEIMRRRAQAGDETWQSRVPFDAQQNSGEWRVCQFLRSVDWEEHYCDPVLHEELVKCKFCRRNLEWLSALDWILLMVEQQPLFIMKELGVNGNWPGWLATPDFTKTLQDRDLYCRKAVYNSGGCANVWKTCKERELIAPAQQPLRPLDPVWQPVLALAYLLDVALQFAQPAEPDREEGFHTASPFGVRTEARGLSYCMASIYDSPFAHRVCHGQDIDRQWYYTPENAVRVPERITVQVDGVVCPNKFLQRTFGVPESEFDNWIPESFGVHCAASVRNHAVASPFGCYYPTFKGNEGNGNLTSKRAHTWFFTDSPGGNGLLCPFQEARWRLNSINNPLYDDLSFVANDFYNSLSPVQRVRYVSGEFTSPLQPIVCPGNCVSADSPELPKIVNRPWGTFPYADNYFGDRGLLKIRTEKNPPAVLDTDLSYPVPTPHGTFIKFSNNPGAWNRPDAESYGEQQYTDLVEKIGEENSVYAYDSASLKQSYLFKDERHFRGNEELVCQHSNLFCHHRCAHIYESDKMLEKNVKAYFNSPAASQHPLLFPDRMAHCCGAFAGKEVHRSLVPTPVPGNVRYLPSQLPLAAALFHAYDRRRAKAYVDEIDHSEMFEKDFPVAASAVRADLKGMLSWHDEFIIAYRRNSLHGTVKELSLDVPNFAAFWDNYRFCLEGRPAVKKLMAKIYRARREGETPLSPNFNENLEEDSGAPTIIPPDCWDIHNSAWQVWEWPIGTNYCVWQDL